MVEVVVVDASIALKWIFREPDSDTAKALLAEWIDKEIVITAPILLAYEVANALHKKTRKGDITESAAQIALKKLLTTGLELDGESLFKFNLRALAIASQFQLPAIYDAHYLALAEDTFRETRNCEFWTADARLWNSVRNKLPWMRWLGDYRQNV